MPRFKARDIDGLTDFKRILPARSLKRQGVDTDSIPNGKWKKLIESCAEKKTQAKEFEKLVRTQVSPQ